MNVYKCKAKQSFHKSTSLCFKLMDYGNPSSNIYQPFLLALLALQYKPQKLEKEQPEPQQADAKISFFKKHTTTTKAKTIIKNKKKHV